MTSITVQSPRPVAVPRGAAWGAWAFRQAGLGLEWLLHLKHTRAAERSLAARIMDANQVRRYARNVAVSDPGFAADLYAAADRHELAD